VHQKTGQGKQPAIMRSCAFETVFIAESAWLRTRSRLLVLKARGACWSTSARGAEKGDRGAAAMTTRPRVRETGDMAGKKVLVSITPHTQPATPSPLFRLQRSSARPGARTNSPRERRAQRAETQRHRPDLQRPTRSVRPPASMTPTLTHGPCGPRPGPPDQFSALHTGTSRNPFRWSDPCSSGLSTGSAAEVTGSQDERGRGC